jgi:hypothetical protein
MTRGRLLLLLEILDGSQAPGQLALVPQVPDLLLVQSLPLLLLLLNKLKVVGGGEGREDGVGGEALLQVASVLLLL